MTLHELERKLQLANIVAKREGVVTWVNKNIGAAIQEGESIARIADLSSFKVQGSISDNYLDQLHNGMTAIIRINETQVRGTVVNIHPSVKMELFHFDIQLDERNNKLLRPNMKVDVFLVTATKAMFCEWQTDLHLKGSFHQDIFVLKNGKAEKERFILA